MVVGVATFIWQMIELMNGNARNMFFAADIIFAVALVAAALIKHDAKASAAMLVAFSGMAGVYAVATFGALTTGTYAFGPFTTTVGLIACLPCMVALYNRFVTAKI